MRTKRIYWEISGQVFVKTPMKPRTPDIWNEYFEDKKCWIIDSHSPDNFVLSDKPAGSSNCTVGGFGGDEIELLD